MNLQRYRWHRDDGILRLRAPYNFCVALMTNTRAIREGVMKKSRSQRKPKQFFEGNHRNFTGLTSRCKCNPHKDCIALVTNTHGNHAGVMCSTQ